MSDDRPVPPLLAERCRRGELPPEEAEAVRRRMARFGDPLAGLPSDDEVLADDPPDAVAREVRRRVAEAEWADRHAVRPSRALLGWAAGLVGALVVSLVVIGDVGPADGPGDVIVKGASDDRLVVWREQGGEPVKLDATAVGGPGDRLQLAYVAPGATDGVLLSVDGRGTVTEHTRFAGRPPVNGEVRLPTAYVLDDAPGFEAFHLITARHALDADALLAAARARGATTEPPPVPDDADVTTFVLRKVGR
jgi:hypothetical protein